MYEFKVKISFIYSFSYITYVFDMQYIYLQSVQKIYLILSVLCSLLHKIFIHP
jgi:hypothetical protein